ncbi:MAG: hypothetical protein ACXW3E_00370 [Thermoanaerobaculia bacterium]
MAEQDGDRAERKVVVETVTSTSTKNSAAAWIIIGIVALGLIVYILMHMR